MESIRLVLNVDDRRINPWTSYPFESNNSARYEPSCPVIPVMNAFFVMSDHVYVVIYREKFESIVMTEVEKKK
jgi:hypothetical protein